MPDYRVEIARSAAKEIERLPTSVVRRVSKKIDELAQNPRPSGCKKLQGSRNRWRVRVGDHRIVYTVDDAHHLIDVSAVRDRKDVYS